MDNIRYPSPVGPAVWPGDVCQLREKVSMSSETAPRALRARYVFPVDRPPIANGQATIAGGRVVAVGKNTSGQPAQDLGNVALLPGLINAHTHLEFSLLEKPLGRPGMSFPSWIDQVIAHRRELAERELDLAAYRRRAISRGLQESAAAGVVAVGEIATPGWPANSYEQGFPGTVFLELLGLSEERIEPLMTLARAHVESPTRANAGLSPHAPYTVHPKLLQQVCELSQQAKVPVAMHLAESIEELELLQSHSGGMVELLQSLGAWFPSAVPRGIRPLEYLQTLSTAYRALVIHGNFLLQDEIDFLAARRDAMTVVYCPRTHAYFSHGHYPLAEMLAAGVRIAVGTDSRASNPDLSVLAELRHIAQHHPAVPREEILKMGTLHGAEGLGLASDLGTIGPGKRAEFCCVPLPAEDGDPYALLLDA